MCSSSTDTRCPVSIALGLLLFAAATGRAAAQSNLLVNGGFEQNNGVGTIPLGWQVDDELFGYFGWIAPRVERQIGEIWPRTGRSMVGLDSELMGVDSNGMDYDTPRAAIRQTVTVSGPARGTFSIHFNDIGSTGLAYISIIRLAYTIDSTDIHGIRVPERRPDTAAAKGRPGVWSRPFHRVSQKLPDSRTSLGDWTQASIPVIVDAASPVRLMVWIGIFDHQNSTEVGYWRIDDAALVLSWPTAAAGGRSGAGPVPGACQVRSGVGHKRALTAEPLQMKWCDGGARSWRAAMATLVNRLSRGIRVLFSLVQRLWPKSAS